MFDMMGMTPVAHTASFKISSVKESRLKAFMEDLARNLEKKGCTLIGHIKCLARSGTGSSGYFSITHFSDPVNYAGVPLAPDKPAQLTLNTIVYGLTPKDVRDLVLSAIHTCFPESVVIENGG